MGSVPPRGGRCLLLAWETGANLGHVFPLARLARQLEAEGFRCVVAAADLASAAIALHGSGLPLLQSPVWPPHAHAGNEDGQAGYLDILGLLGFGDPGKLGPVMQAWDGLLDLIRPDAVIADHAPALIPLLKARGIATIAVGNGFTLPPLVPTAFPPLSASRAPTVPETRLLASLRQALASLGHAALPDWRSAFETRERIVFSAPELDPYHGLRQEPLCLPPEPLPAATAPPPTPRLFVYIGAELPGLSAVVQCLSQLDCEVECYLRGLPAQACSFLASQGVTVHRSPPDLSETLPRASHVLSQGGSGMAHAALAAGRPHGILALHGESRINAQSLVGLGAGRLFPLGLDAEALLPVLKAFIADPELPAQALGAGRRLHGRGNTDGAEALRAALARSLR
ncbi:MAG: hypothetical protein JG765_598 [Cereibacter sp.]|jgi:hypothetical protein|nr:hypothetical protein [Cereibacter sp.]